MALMSSAPEGAETTEVNVDEAEPEAQTQEAAPAPEPKNVTVPVPAAPPRRLAERQRREALENEIAGIKESQTKTADELRRQLAESQQQLARVAGMIEAGQRQQQPNGQQQAPQGPDPAALMREAQAALDGRDFDTYQKKTMEAMTAEAERRILPRVQSMIPQQQQTQSLPPDVQLAIMSTPSASKVLGRQNGMQYAILMDQQLALDGIPPSVERYKKAFDLAEQKIFGGQAETGFSANGRQTLAGIPASRGNGGVAAKSAPQVDLPPNWQIWADRAGMNRDEYIREFAKSFPDKVRE